MQNNKQQQDDIWEEHESHHQYDSVMQEKHYQSLYNQFATLGYKDGAAQAHDQELQVGFEKGLQKGVEEHLLRNQMLGILQCFAQTQPTTSSTQIEHLSTFISTCQDEQQLLQLKQGINLVQHQDATMSQIVTQMAAILKLF